MVGCDEKAFRKCQWQFVDGMAALKEKLVSIITTEKNIKSDNSYIIISFNITIGEAGILKEEC